jgi:hypothetical protein
VTNGTRLLVGVDGRSAQARRYRDLCLCFPDDLGCAAELSEAQRSLIRQAAALLVQSEHLQAAVLRGETVDNEHLTRLSNAATRVLAQLGIKKGKPAEPQTRLDAMLGSAV